MLKFFKNLTVYLFLFIIADIIFSNFIYKDKFKHSCKESIGSQGFFHLSANCSIQEKYIKYSRPYKVLTDGNGLRYSGVLRDSDKENVIFFGDSFTYGLGLNYEDTFIGLLEKKFKKYNFLNYSVIGYSPSVYLYQLEKIVHSNINVKKIILPLDISDFSEESSGWNYKKGDNYPKRFNFIKKNEKLKKESFKDKNLKASRFIASKVNNFFRNVKLNRLYKDKNRNKKKKKKKTVIGNFLYTPIDQTDPNLWKPLGFNGGLKKLESNISEISLLAKKINAEFHILIYPWPDTLEFGQKQFNLEQFSTALCLKIYCMSTINTFSEFEEVRKTDKENWLNKLYILGDLHVNKFGHKLIADKISTEVFSNEK